MARHDAEIGELTKLVDRHLVRHAAWAESRGELTTHSAAMAKLDQEVFYLSSEDYQKFALQQIDEARRYIAELGLKQE